MNARLNGPQAYILGFHDHQYKDMLDKVDGIVFLATPHRGSNLADTLKTFLSASFQSPKQYVSDLQTNSAMISDINDQFKLHAGKFQLISFFETLPTSIGIRKTVSYTGHLAFDCADVANLK